MFCQNRWQTGSQVFYNGWILSRQTMESTDLLIILAQLISFDCSQYSFNATYLGLPESGSVSWINLPNIQETHLMWNFCCLHFATNQLYSISLINFMKLGVYRIDQLANFLMMCPTFQLTHLENLFESFIHRLASLQLLFCILYKN